MWVAGQELLRRLKAGRTLCQVELVQSGRCSSEVAVAGWSYSLFVITVQQENRRRSPVSLSVACSAPRSGTRAFSDRRHHSSTRAPTLIPPSIQPLIDFNMPPKQHKPPRRTMELPASLRAELQALGQLPKPGKGKLGRKDRRKAARQDGKQNRAAHFAKRKAEQDEQSEDEPAPAPQPKPQPKSEPAPKRRKVAEPEPEREPAKKQSALERMLAKQEGTVVDPERAKSKAESYEDQEIAWLEAKLGVRGPQAKAEKGKWKDEFQDDGLDGEQSSVMSCNCVGC